jgi:hypothetical protein
VGDGRRRGAFAGSTFAGDAAGARYAGSGLKSYRDGFSFGNVAAACG